MTVVSVSSNQSLEFLVVHGVVRSALVSSTVRLFIVMTCSAMVHAIGAFGIASNIVNIAVFATQGFSDSVNISLTTLAVSDLMTITTAQWLLLCLNPWFQANLDLSFYAAEVQTLTGGYPHVFFSRVSAWVTAFISLERAVAVTQPFRVRRIFTRRVTTAFSMAVFPVVWAGAAPLYATARLGKKFFPAPVNSTLFGLLFSPNHGDVMKATSPVTEIFGPIANFSVVIVCSAIIRIKVTSMARWRSKVTGTPSQATDTTGQPTDCDQGNQKQSFKLEMTKSEKTFQPKAGETCNSSAELNGADTAVNRNSKTQFSKISKTSGNFSDVVTPNPSSIAEESKSSTVEGKESSRMKTNPLSGKERRLVVMVSAVAAIFIACYTPLVMQLAARIIVPELSSTGRYRSLNATIGVIGIMLGCLNASINAIVYWRMSTNYKTTFRRLVSTCRRSR